MIKQNLHTHSTFCDGVSTCEEMIKSAINCGFSSLGFSGHAYSEGIDYCMSKENTKKYFTQTEILKQQYKNEIAIYIGLEYDCFSKCDTSKCDYIIGATHEIYKNGELLSIDYTEECTNNNLKNHFGGNVTEYIKAYYDMVKKIPELTKCDIIAHFDLITKFSELNNVINPESDEYLTYALDALRHISKSVKIFEVNTGAISRGYRTTPYPHHTIVKEMKSLGMVPTISSDCHNAQHIDCGYEQAKQLLKDSGYTEIVVFDGNRFIPTSL